LIETKLATSFQQYKVNKDGVFCKEDLKNQIYQKSDTIAEKFKDFDRFSLNRICSKK